jgi:putative Ca2+/H+ antiporter (TMEM165/GDT1 family)
MVWYVALAVAFATIAVAELADKTQLVTISQACRYPAAPVLAGSAAALIMVTAIGVAGGTVLYLLLPPDALSLIAGVLFLVFGAFMVWRWHRGRRVDPECEVDAEAEDGAECETGNLRIFASTFGLVALAELGDKTQLAVVALTGEYGNPYAVFIGASLALVLVSAIGVAAGRVVARKVSLAHIELVAAALFIVLGVVFLLGAL